MTAGLRDNWQAIQHGIEGWLEGNALEPLCLTDEVQQELGIPGNLAEIGLHHGKLLAALSWLARSDETVVGIDCFEDQHFNENQGDCCGDRELVRVNMDRYGAPVECRLVKSDSLILGSNPEFIDRAPYRLFSIDGSHTEKYALNDLVVVSRMLSPGGVVLLDDFRHPAWPGVEQGAEMFFAINPSLAPFLLAANKLFLTTPRHHNAHIAPWRGRGRVAQIFGYDVVVA